MSGPSPKKSPFKAVAAKNANHCGFISMSKLEPNKPYMMMDMKSTHHAVYGDGLLSFLKGKNAQQWRSQFPPKYLQNFTDEDIKELRLQISNKKYPFVIFREVLADNSFRIDLAPYSDELVTAHNRWTEVGPIVLSPDSSLDNLDNDQLDASTQHTEDVNSTENSSNTTQDEVKIDGNGFKPTSTETTTTTAPLKRKGQDDLADGDNKKSKS